MRCFFGVFLLLIFDLKAQILFTDSFDGAEIDSTKWDIFLPFSDSAVYVQNGILKSRNYGFVVSKQSFEGPCSISAVIGRLGVPSFVIKSNDQFLLRQTGLSRENLWQQTDASLLNCILFAIGSVTIPGDTYAGSENDEPFVINDYGNLITSQSWSWNGVTKTYTEEPLWPDLWLSSNEPPPVFTGSKIGFFGSDQNEVSLFSVTVSVPEPCAVSLLAVGLGGLALVRRRRS